MKKISSTEIESILGIFSPFKVTDVSIDNQTQSIEVKIIHLDSQKKTLFGKNTNLSIAAWNHISIGTYSSCIIFQYDERVFNDFNNPHLPIFLGHPHYSYTKQLEETTELLIHQKLSDKVISGVLALDITVVESIRSNLSDKDINTQEMILPGANSRIWRRIISGDKSLRFKYMPLQMLVANLCNKYKSSSDVNTLNESCNIIYNFFNDNKRYLEEEYRHIGYHHKHNTNDNETKVVQQNRTTLNIDHPIWDQLLKGVTFIHTKDVGLNLKLTNLRSRYDGCSDDEKTTIKKQFLIYLKENSRSLQKELGIIKRYAEMIDKKAQDITLPDINDPIWGGIITGSVKLNSTAIAFNLYLNSLRYSNQHNPEKSIRAFLVKNAPSLESEINQINSISSREKVSN